MPLSFCMSRPPLLFLFVTLGLLFTTFIYYFHDSPSVSLRPSQWRQPSQTLAIPAAHRIEDARCAGLPSELDNIVLVVKTGATEAYEKLPTQIMTVLQCAKDVLLFSDLEQDIGSYHVYDSLAQMSPEAMNNTDFEFYHALQKYRAEGRDVRQLNKMKDLREAEQTMGHNAAWALDKYKNVYVTERSWELAPGRDWYVFIDADTYVVWANLLRWLHRFDPNEKLYLGRAVPMHEEGPGFYFAHGGSGYVLSRAAMEEYAVNQKGIASRWDYRMADMWFGDYIQAKVLKSDLGLSLTDAWPQLNGDKVATLPFSEETWCEEVITLHHVRPEEVQALWDYEQRRYKQSEHAAPPLTFAELFEAFVQGDGQFPASRDDWDNLSHDEDYMVKKPELEDEDANSTPISCSRACQEVEDCMQWSHLKFSVADASGQSSGGGVCYLSKVFRFGEERNPGGWTDKKGNQNTHIWASGWKSSRIQRWLATADCIV